jgi:putative Mg2+ transporter-C (MgtC) family protein
MFDFINIEPLELKGLLIAVICGLIIGFERQWNGKPAGIRTSILICLSAFTFVSIGKFYQPDIGSVRIVGQIVTGIGFLGAGVILAREGLVIGVTSASVIWSLAAIGSLIGLHHYPAAIVLTLTVEFILIGINFLERAVTKLRQGGYDHRKKEERRETDTK